MLLVLLLPSPRANNLVFVFAATGAAASIARAGLRSLRVLARRRLLTSLEVPIRDPAYPWVLQWLIAK